MERIKSISIVGIDYKNVNIETLEAFLRLFGFERRVSQYYIDFSKSQDPETERHRQALREHGFKPDPYTKSGLFHGMIVPDYDAGEVMFIIRESELNRIVKALKENTNSS
jgi:hypothetical protein